MCRAARKWRRVGSRPVMIRDASVAVRDDQAPPERSQRGTAARGQGHRKRKWLTATLPTGIKKRGEGGETQNEEPGSRGWH
eukprot:2738627-Pyramimonas_sp.AAC.1